MEITRNLLLSLLYSINAVSNNFLHSLGMQIHQFSVGLKGNPSSTVRLTVGFRKLLLKYSHQKNWILIWSIINLKLSKNCFKDYVILKVIITSLWYFSIISSIVFNVGFSIESIFSSSSEICEEINKKFFITQLKI